MAIIHTVAAHHMVSRILYTGKSLSEVLIFASTNSQCSNLDRTCCAKKLFLTFRTIFVHDMFSPCSAKRRASDKDLLLPIPIFLDWSARFGLLNSSSQNSGFYKTAVFPYIVFSHSLQVALLMRWCKPWNIFKVWYLFHLSLILPF